MIMINHIFRISGKFYMILNHRIHKSFKVIYPWIYLLFWYSIYFPSLYRLSFEYISNLENILLYLFLDKMNHRNSSLFIYIRISLNKNIWIPNKSRWILLIIISLISIGGIIIVIIIGNYNIYSSLYLSHSILIIRSNSSIILYILY
jgi:hypothetical protein